MLHQTLLLPTVNEAWYPLTNQSTLNDVIPLKYCSLQTSECLSNRKIVCWTPLPLQSAQSWERFYSRHYKCNFLLSLIVYLVDGFLGILILDVVWTWYCTIAMVNRICSSYWLMDYAVRDWNRDHRDGSPMTKHYISDTISARLSERLYFRSSAIRPHVFC
jgi:hypothetical protein